MNKKISDLEKYLMYRIREDRWAMFWSRLPEKDDSGNKILENIILRTRYTKNGKGVRTIHEISRELGISQKETHTLLARLIRKLRVPQLREQWASRDLTEEERFS